MKSIEHKDGFTLIELLVVIAIIAILAAILFPVFMSAKDNARTATCSSNIEQMEMAITLYAGDNNGWIPPLWPNGIYVWETNGLPSTWKDLIKPYINAIYLYACPADITPLPTNTPWIANDYGLNPGFQIFNNKGAWRYNWQLYYCAPIPLSLVTKPTHTLLIADIYGYDAQVWYPANYVLCHPTRCPRRKRNHISQAQWRSKCGVLRWACKVGECR